VNPGPLPSALEWEGGIPGTLLLLDQTLLPDEERRLRIDRVAPLIEAIQRLAVRGAPALGCAGAYGAVLAAQSLQGEPASSRLARLEESAARLAAARPTAVNLARGVERILVRARALSAAAGDPPGGWARELLDEARAFHREDEVTCRAIGRNGAALLSERPAILTHCNAGALATGGAGTALAVVYAARDSGRQVSVFANETRPLLQGARLTAWELQRAGIPVTLEVDAAAGALLASGRVDAVVVGADRIAANGDVANKIGTYPLAVLAREHGVPFYVAAPLTTIDATCPDGGAIPVEQRPPEEVLEAAGRRFAPPGVPAWNPAFDVTPARLVTALITEAGVVRAPDRAAIAALLAGRPAGGPAPLARQTPTSSG